MGVRRPVPGSQYRAGPVPRGQGTRYGGRPAAETWLAAARNLASFGDETAFRGWLFTIARRRLVQHWRDSGRRPVTAVAPERLTDRRAADDPEAEGLAAVSAREAARAIAAALPPDQADVVLLRMLGGLDVDQVAGILGKRPGTVRVLQHKALRRLADRFSPETNGGSEAWRWSRRLPGARQDLVQVERCTGWRFVAEELRRAGHVVHVAEPADTRMLCGKKKRAKTDRADARHLRVLLMQDRVPESWVPPTHVLEIRARARLYVGLMDERRAWQQRIQAQLFHQGVPAFSQSVLSADGRERLARAKLSPAGRQIVDIALSAADHLTGLVDPLREELMAFAPRQAGCRGLMAIYGVGALVAPVVWAELGDTRRFSSSEKAVRYTGLDVTVWSSDGKRRGQGHLSRQVPPALRWALFEAAYVAARTSSPDHAYYLEVRARQGASRAALSVARKLVRRAHHVLRDLGDSAWKPAA